MLTLALQTPTAMRRRPRYFASGCIGGAIQLWDLHASETPERPACRAELQTATAHAAITQLDFSCDGNGVFGCMANGIVALYDIGSGTCTRRIDTRRHGVLNGLAALRSDPDSCVVAGDDGMVMLYDFRMPRAAAWKYMNWKSYPITCVTVGSRDVDVFFGGVDGFIRCADVSQKYAASSHQPDQASHDTMSRKRGRDGALGRPKQKREAYLPLWQVNAHQDIVSGLSYHAESERILSVGMDSTAAILDAKPFVAPGSERLLKCLPSIAANTERSLLRCAYAPDGMSGIVGSSTSHIVWLPLDDLEDDSHASRSNVRQPSTALRVGGHEATVNDVKYHPDSRVISACADGKIIVGPL